MRFFEMVNIDHVVLYLFPTLAFIVLFAIGLGFYHFHTKDSDKRMKEIIESFPGGIEGREAPFPLIVWAMIIVG